MIVVKKEFMAIPWKIGGEAYTTIVTIPIDIAKDGNFVEKKQRIKVTLEYEKEGDE